MLFSTLCRSGGQRSPDLRLVGLLEIPEAWLVHHDQAPLRVAADARDPTAGLRVGQSRLAAVEHELHVLGAPPGLRDGVAGGIAVRQQNRLTWDSAIERRPQRAPTVDEELPSVEVADVCSPGAFDVIGGLPSGHAPAAADDRVLLPWSSVAVRLVDHGVTAGAGVALDRREAERLGEGIGTGTHVDHDVCVHRGRSLADRSLCPYQCGEGAFRCSRPCVIAVRGDVQLLWARRSTRTCGGERHDDQASDKRSKTSGVQSGLSPPKSGEPCRDRAHASRLGACVRAAHRTRGWTPPATSG